MAKGDKVIREYDAVFRKHYNTNLSNAKIAQIIFQSKETRYKSADTIRGYVNKWVKLTEGGKIELEPKVKELTIERVLIDNPIRENEKVNDYLLRIKNISEYCGLECELSSIKQTFYSSNKVTKKEKSQIKKGFEDRGQYVINWTNNTIITDLGEYGSYVASFDRHSLIQRKYVYSHGNETAAIVAMEFDFAHTKAVYIYAKIHGFSKASPGQTDLEFELGLSVEEAVEQNIQTLKRRTYKKTQKREWDETIKAAGKWWNFENTILESLQAIDFDSHNVFVPTLQLDNDHQENPFIAIIGITDVHYLKLCYDHKGSITYDRDIAREKLKQHTIELGKEVKKFGRPEYFYVAIGNDNIHVDGIHHSTTRGTSQHEATDGLWRLELKNYIQMQIDLINHYKAISKVRLMPVKGNHDFETSIALQAFLSIHFQDDPQVEVIECHDSRVYSQWEDICVAWCHGDELKTIKNLENKAHMVFMGEAKNQGVDIMHCKEFLMCHGHTHIENTIDLGAGVKRIGFSSLSGVDDYWHKENAYGMRTPESMVVIAEKGRGRKGYIWV